MAYEIIYLGISAKITGKRSGKDTFADYFIEEFNKISGFDMKAVKRALADPLKAACQEIFLLSHKQIYGNQEEKESQTNFEWPANNVYGKSGLMSAREILQYFGSEIMRDHFAADIWIKSLKEWAKVEHQGMYLRGECSFVGSYLITVVSDIRFVNEANAMDYMVDIFRPELLGNKSDVHRSELSGQDISDNIYDFKVMNDGTLEDLKEKAVYYAGEFYKNKITNYIKQ